MDTNRSTATAGRDGRDVRWEHHREQRRSALVDATIRAIRRHGATVGMDDIAAEAGTSKTVIYRHFDDKAGLYRAVAERIDQRVVRDVGAALSASSSASTPRQLIASTVEAYLSLVESDTEVYRFVVNRPLVDLPLSDDPVGGTVSHITDQLTEQLALDWERAPGAERLGAHVRPEQSSAQGHSSKRSQEQSQQQSQQHRDQARVWAIALVGSVQAVADDWLAGAERLPRPQLVAALTDLAWRGLAPLLGEPTQSDHLTT